MNEFSSPIKSDLYHVSQSKTQLCAKSKRHLKQSDSASLKIKGWERNSRQTGIIKVGLLFTIIRQSVVQANTWWRTLCNWKPSSQQSLLTVTIICYKAVSFIKQKLPVQQTPRNTDKNIHHKKTYYVSKKTYKVDQKHVTMQEARII